MVHLSSETITHVNERTIHLLVCQGKIFYDLEEAIIVVRRGRKVQREKLAVIGKYLDDALWIAHMTRAELARRAGVEGSTVTRVCNAQRTVSRETLLKWCDIMQCPSWLETCILNAAGYASRAQVEEANRLVDEVEPQVQEEMRKRRSE